MRNPGGEFEIDAQAYARARVTSVSRLKVTWSHHHGNWDVVFDLRGKSISPPKYETLKRKIEDFVDEMNEGFEASHRKSLQSPEGENYSA